jgi:dTDP-6-deoxy-L-talose 4-dehydrogenase (NAD+)
LDFQNPPSNAYEYIGRPDVLIHLAWNSLDDYRSLLHFEHELPTHYQFLKGLIQAGLPSLLVSGTCFEYGMQSSLTKAWKPGPAHLTPLPADSMRAQLQFLKRHVNTISPGQGFSISTGKVRPKVAISQLQQAVVRGDGIFNMSEASNCVIIGWQPQTYL